MSDTSQVDGIDQALADAQYAFFCLPDADLELSGVLRSALDSFTSYDNPAGHGAAAWLRTCALPEHDTSRTTLLLGHGHIAGFYSLAAAHVELNESERADAELHAERKRVPATALTWIAKDPRYDTGHDLFLHAFATARRARATVASAVFVLEAHSDETAELWLRRPYELRRLKNVKSGRRLWLPLGPV